MKTLEQRLAKLVSVWGFIFLVYFKALKNKRDKKVTVLQIIRLGNHT